MRAYGFIFARGGSKGLPGKNIRLLGGEPPWSGHPRGPGVRPPGADHRLHDDPAIAAVARNTGRCALLLPAELASRRRDERAGLAAAIQQVSGGGDPPFDVFVSLPPPVRSGPR
jgi:N-acylneuraminate cytidylyltransferase